MARGCDAAGVEAVEVFMRVALFLVPLCACAWTPGTEPPTAAPPDFSAAAITIDSPATGSTSVAAADAAGTLPIAFTVTGVTLAPPGGCGPADGPCGHVLLHIDGDLCNDIASPWNAAAWSSPAGARLALCPAGVEGAHSVRLQLVDNHREPILGASGSPVEATVQFSATVPSLYERLGGGEGIHDAIETFFAQGMLAYPNVAHYFMNADQAGSTIVHCMSNYLAMKAGGPETYDCRSMQDAHSGLGISAADWASFRDALVGHFGSRGVEASDVEELFQSHLLADYTAIVEDVKNYDTVYQRVGRWAGIKAAVEGVGNRMIGDPLLGPFFVGGDPSGVPEYSSRATFCLARFICAIDGPCQYGQEILHPAVATGPCRDIAALHEGMTNALGEPVGPQHLAAMWMHVDGAFTDAGVNPTDIALIQSAFAPRCPEVLADPADCGT